jgi:O-Antigen ligase
MSHTARSGEEYRARDHRSGRSTTAWASLSKVGLALLLGLPGALTVYFAFNSGGMFEVTIAFGALVVLVAMALGAAVAREPLAGLTLRGLLACGSLALFALWTLLSARWSHATGRALVAFDRVLLYLAILTLFACIPRSVMRMRWMLRGLLLGAAAVSVIGLTSRLLPALWPSGHGLVEERLSYPITYWNTFGLLVGVACILAVHHTCDEHEPPVVRICAAAVLPLLGATLLLTFSRGALAVTALGMLVYLVIARPRGLLGGMLAIAPTTALAVSRTYSADLVQKGTPLTSAAIAEGHRLALTLGACALAAALLRALALALDARIARISISRSRSRRISLVAAAGAGVIVLIVLIAAHGATRIHDQYEKFVNDTHESHEIAEGSRGHLLYVGNDGRLPLWRVALDAYRQDPLKGTGAGTYRLQWERHQQAPYDRVYAYSLYAEVLGELGLVGIVLLGVSLLSILVAIAVRARGPGRPVYAISFALVLAWIVHAGVDIDWQTPAVSVFVFALGGLALARSGEQSLLVSAQERQYGRRLWIRVVARLPSSWLRPVLVLACLAVAVVPARMGVAQARLQDSIEALDTGACARAQRSAHGAISVLDTGSRPYEVLAMCAARQGDQRAVVSWARMAVAQDPKNWEPHYVLALAQGVAGIDPRWQARTAYQDNPLGQMAQKGVNAFRGSDRQHWESAAYSLPFSFDWSHIAFDHRQRPIL